MFRRMKLLPSSRLALVACISMLAAGCFAMESTMASQYARLNGKIVSLHDPLFAVKVQKTGLWKPYRFIKTIGFALFEMTDHRQDRLPVIFVHGYLSSPETFKTLVAALDKEKYEPYLAYYATGQKLELTAKSMRCAVRTLSREKGIDRVAIVSHSMGGLVTRRYLGDEDDDPGPPAVPLFISLSTPWGGSEFLEKVTWVQGEPDSWVDLKPGSMFLKHLYDGPLPEGTAFHLLYGSKGDSDRLPKPNDGTITVKSATRKEALAEATDVKVCPSCTHQGIKKDEGPVSWIIEILDACRKKMLQPEGT